MEFTGIVKDPQNDKDEEDNTFTVRAEDVDDAAEYIAKKYVERYKLCHKHQVDEAVIVINNTSYGFDYYESWQYLVIKKD